jgi:epoxyqueuosine reductase
MSLKAALKERALEIGFDLVGIAPMTPGCDLEFARAWVERGYAGEMPYLSNPKRFDPREVLPSVKSVICVGLIYNTLAPYSTEVVGTGVRSQSSVVPAGRDQLSVALRHEPRTIDHGQRTTDNGRAPVSSCQFPISAAGGTPRAWISRYAWGRDYHEVVRRKLERLRAAVEASIPGVETRVYVDTGPIVERAFARFSGVGWMGKNTCIISEQKGSWLFLGVILTNLDLEPDLPAPDRCGSCTRCLEACPTAALVEPYVMDASRCISYLTIEFKGSVPPELRSAVGVNIFGCDICQDVCPWNAGVRRPLSVVSGQLQRTSDQPSAFGLQQSVMSGVPSATEQRPTRSAITSATEFQPSQVSTGETRRRQQAMSDRGIKPDREEIGCYKQAQPTESCLGTTDDGQLTTDAAEFSLFNPLLKSLAALSEDDFRRIFRHSPIKRVKYPGWLRNLCVAMGNSGDPRFIPYLQRACEHPDPVVREHAAWALARLQSR